MLDTVQDTMPRYNLEIKTQIDKKYLLIGGALIKADTEVSIKR